LPQKKLPYFLFFSKKNMAVQRRLCFTYSDDMNTIRATPLIRRNALKKEPRFGARFFVFIGYV